MAPTIPKTQKQWTLEGKRGIDSLTWNDQAPVPEVGEYDVLVKFHAASLNYRDLTIPIEGGYPFPTTDSVIPGSDGAGEIVATGSKVTRFTVGDLVLTLFNQEHLSGFLTPRARMTGLGGQLDGTLRQYGAFHELGVVKMPGNLDVMEAATLSCAALTAWNALYGVEGRALRPGDWVLTQGTGGVSMFGLQVCSIHHPPSFAFPAVYWGSSLYVDMVSQFAKAAGAKVIATTSSAAKAEKLKQLGADHVINYKTQPHWGEMARELTGSHEGVAHVIEVGGPTTVAESLAAVRMEGVISIIGYIGGQTEVQPTFHETLVRDCIVRGIQIGSREQLEAMNRAVEGCDIHPVVDEKVFRLEELKEAYQYMWDQKHFGKLRIKIEH
ncbi:GroES-like protein [Aaosphaeria arxii CBS 175.79]|uniref:GroES-like protein n=1 Tax=Aaosphaeria arxii CBS 175.79 TaxID=1450172 RepID=A0A6A5Y1N7_9PLEO|nr:GroES-like protein [Aaosphaeria arxii CBS 175.79]KAF2019113.1 GroES-like protein [Aaosphaeria arxii CBS 175.79]